MSYGSCREQSSTDASDSSMCGGNCTPRPGCASSSSRKVSRIKSNFPLASNIPCSYSFYSPVMSDDSGRNSREQTAGSSANEMRTAAQRALFKQNSARAVQAAGLARHRSQPREKHQCGRYDHGVAQHQVGWKKRLDWTRCRCCSVTNATIVLDLHAWMPAEVFK